MAMTTCKECEKAVSTDAKTCPHCGTSAPAKKKAKGGIGKWLLIVFAIGLVAMILPKQDKATPVASAPPKVSTARAAEAPKVPAPSVEKLTEGQQKALDDLREQKARYDKLDAEVRENWDAETKADAKLLRACLEHQVCDVSTYPRLLRDKSRFFVFDILGDPVSEQSIGGREIYYFTVPIADGRKRAKLQLSFDLSIVDTANVY